MRSYVSAECVWNVCETGPSGEGGKCTVRVSFFTRGGGRWFVVGTNFRQEGGCIALDPAWPEVDGSDIAEEQGDEEDEARLVEFDFLDCGECDSAGRGSSLVLMPGELALTNLGGRRLTCACC